MKLKKLFLQHFRCHTDLKVNLNEDLTVIVGNNGAGKSSILDVITILLEQISESAYQCLWGSFRAGDRVGSRVGSGVYTRALKFFWNDIQLNENGKAYPFSKLGISATGLDGPDARQWGISQYRGPLDEEADNDEQNELVDPFVQTWVRKFNNSETFELPVFAVYSTTRHIPPLFPPWFNADTSSTAPSASYSRSINVISSDEGQPKSSRFEALFPDSGAQFEPLVAWFAEQERRENREIKERKSFDYKLPALEVVRTALSAAVPGFSRPRMDEDGRQLEMDEALPDGSSRTLSLSQFSDGYRTMLAMVMDFARRMAQANPHLEKPLEAEGVMVVDEIDLHLHPKWQQTVIDDLRRAFPNTQFIFTTHSPQVLTTVAAESIQCLVDKDGVTSLVSPSHARGLESNRVLRDVLGVSPRPNVDATKDITANIDKYFDLIDEGKGQSDEAEVLRKKLVNLLGPDDKLIMRADSALRRRVRNRQ